MHQDLWLEPTDIVEASKVFMGGNINFPNFISPNYYELQEIIKIVNPSLATNLTLNDDECLDKCIDQGLMLTELVENVIVTLGKRGVLLCRKRGKNDPIFDVSSTGKPIYLKSNRSASHALYECDQVLDEEVVNVSGAGDCFASGFIAAMLRGEDEEHCVRFGFKCALLSLRSSTTVPESFCF